MQANFIIKNLEKYSKMLVPVVYESVLYSFQHCFVWFYFNDSCFALF